MKIALDATPLSTLTGGIRRYTEELARALARLSPENEYWLLSDVAFPFEPNGLSNLKQGSGPRNLLERRWWSFGLNAEIARRGINVFHGTDFAVPYVPLRPAVLTIHDLSPWLDRGWHHAADRIRTRTPLLLRLGLATMIITPSEAIRREVLRRFRLQADRVVATPLAASPLFHPTDSPAPRQKYLLYAGTLEPRKNVPFVLECWREVRKTHAVELCIAGRRREDAPDIPAEPGLRLLGPVPDSALPELYSHAAAVLYPSLYEGFGLPVLEAMQCGAFVLTSRDPAIAEVAGEDGAVRLDPADAHAWVATLNAALEDPSRTAETRANAVARARVFSWEQTARMTQEVYGEAIRRFRR